MREQLVAKLRPDRFTAMSGKMAAIVGYILDERFSEPAISELVVTSDGFVLAQTEGEVGANDMLGTEVDLNRNLLDLIKAAGLTAEEIHEFGRLQRKHFGATGNRQVRDRDAGVDARIEAFLTADQVSVSYSLSQPKSLMSWLTTSICVSICGLAKSTT